MAVDNQIIVVLESIMAVHILSASSMSTEANFVYLTSAMMLRPPSVENFTIFVST